MSDQSPFPSFRENSPLADLPTDSVDEFLSRINDDLVAGAPERITDDRLDQLISIYRTQAVEWEIKQREKPARKTAAQTKKSVAEALGINLDDIKL